MSRTFKDTPDEVRIARRHARGKHRTKPHEIGSVHNPHTGENILYLRRGNGCGCGSLHSHDTGFYDQERAAVRDSLAHVHAHIHTGVPEDFDDSSVEVRPKRRGLWGGGYPC